MIPPARLIAIYTNTLGKTIAMYNQLGHSQVGQDSCVFDGVFHGERKTVTAYMAFFNTIVPGVLVEILQYGTGNPFGFVDGRSPFVAHHAGYVDDVDEAAGKLADATGTIVHSRFSTHEHTNPEIIGMFRFKEAIVGTKDVLGYDYKLMQKIPHE